MLEEREVAVAVLILWSRPLGGGATPPLGGGVPAAGPCARAPTVTLLARARAFLHACPAPPALRRLAVSLRHAVRAGRLVAGPSSEGARQG